MKTISGSELVVGPVELRDLPRRVDAGEAGHADVEEDEVGPVLVDQRHRLGAVLRLGDDLQLGPGLGESRAQLLAHQAFVVGDDGGDGRGVAHPPSLR